ncbi:MAG: glycosyltransferase family 4 protein [Azonexus sp.]|jgi:UDP-glucose:(heptosyl)LPS alpha-1,3-glucosyltransferase|nr:glycosyltransferase family 4 protein [Azonexus sp.]
MQLAFCLYKYFPYGGLQRDFLRIALACQARGHAVRVYTLRWEGDAPPGFEVVSVPVKALTNIGRYRKFTAWVAADLRARPTARVVGFNKMPGLDVYYAADPCYEEKARTLRNPLYRFSSRYRHFSAYERAVFAPTGRTEVLLISSIEQGFFEKYYGTPRARLHLLPPGIAPDRRAPPEAPQIRAAFRAEFGLAEADRLLLQLGSGFKRKGLDRSLLALASLSDDLRRRTRLIAIGQGESGDFLRQAKALGVGERVTILPGRDDVPRFLLGADLLLHPAYHENTGTVLLEALVAGLPVLCSGICGYAHYIVEADAGRVIPEPFVQAEMNRLLQDMVHNDAERRRWQANALAFAGSADLYSSIERAADLILAAGG